MLPVMRSCALQVLWLLGVILLWSPEESRAQVPSLDPSISAVTTGGYWEAGGQNGTIRLIVVTGGGDHIVSTLHAQWIAEGAEQTSSRIVRSALVAAISPGVFALETPRFELVDKRWRATVEGTNTHTSPPERQGWVLTFGAPGEVEARPMLPRNSASASLVSGDVAIPAPTPQFELLTWGGPMSARFVVLLRSDGLLRVDRVALLEKQAHEVRLDDKVMEELTLLATRADDFSTDCLAVADGTSALLAITIGGKPIRRLCENARSWPTGPKTSRFLERLNSLIPSDLRVY
jgi:hypothetical protein